MYVRIFKNLEQQVFKRTCFYYCLGVFPEFSDIAKTRSPGSFPEGEVGFPGRGPGRFFSLVVASSPEKVWKDSPISRKGTGRVSGREKSKSVTSGAVG